MRHRTWPALAVALGAFAAVWNLVIDCASVPPVAPRRRALVGSCVLPSVAAKAAQAAVRQPGPAQGDISGGALPLTVGLGTCLVSEANVPKQAGAALAAGYRVFDTAQRYENEAGLGQALRSAFEAGLKRSEIFVTTKIWVSNYGFDKAMRSVRASAKKLGLDSIDLVLPHWPGVGTRVEAASENFRLRQETWRALEALKQEGVARQIGVSNYNERHLQELLGYAEVRPVASQFEVHPFNVRAGLVDLCQAEGICVNGYSPLGGKGNPGAVTDQLLNSPLLRRMAAEHGKTAAQVILRWHLQRGITPIPKASSEKRIRENYDVFDFALSPSEMAEISNLDRAKFAVMDSKVFL